jgi:hypothetical protein
MGILDLPESIPDPRPDKADPHHRERRKKIEEKNPGFGWKKMLVLGLAAVTLLMDVPREVEKHEAKHKRNRSISRSSKGSHDRRSRSRGQGHRRDRGEDHRDYRRRDGGQEEGSKRRARSSYGYDYDDGRRDYQRSGRYDDRYYGDDRRRDDHYSDDRRRDDHYWDERRDDHYGRPSRGRTYSQSSW